MMKSKKPLNTNPYRRIVKSMHAKIPIDMYEILFRMGCERAMNGDREAAQWVINEIVVRDREVVRLEFESIRSKPEFRSIFKGKPCVKCGKPSDTIDHIVPLTKGGDNSLENLQPMCWNCNRAKSNVIICEEQ
jgi:hypothetical protein